MARKQINVFGLSFLDLLSGALGAVIILYIILPQITAQQADILNQVQSLDAELTEIHSLIIEYRQSFPVELHEELDTRFQLVDDHIKNLQQERCYHNSTIKMNFNYGK